VTRAVRSPLARALALSTALLVASLAAPSAARAAPLKIVVPDPDNLQYLSFWVAVGAGYFRDEGVELEPWIPPAPQATTQAVVEGKAEVAVLSPPMYLELIDRRVPVVLVANLLKNDAINLIVRRTVIESRKLSPSASLVDRLRGLHGLKIGIAPNPPRRLRALFASVGLDADRELQLVILSGPQQNAAFERGEVDALYAHTPYLEKALTDDGAMMWVNQSAGEVPSLATRQIHALVVTRAFAAAQPRVVTAMTRAIYRAQKLVHADRAAAAAAIERQFPAMAPRHVEAILALYAPAVPESPVVSADGFAPALALFPANRPAPDLSGVDLASYVAPAFAERVVSPRASAARWAIAALAIAAALMLALYGARRGRARARR